MSSFGIKTDKILYHHNVSDDPNKKDFSNHTHEEAELYMFLGGKAVFHVEGTEYELHPGDVLIMRPAESHYVEPGSELPYDRIAIQFPLDLFREFDPDGLLELPFLNHRAGVNNLYPQSSFAKDLKYTYFDRLEEPNGERFILPVLFSVLTEISIAFNQDKIAPKSRETAERQWIRYINEHLDTNMTLYSLANRFYISPSTLERRFKKATGTTVAQYLNIKRLMKARVLLQHGSRPTEIFRDVGFSDYSAFYRAYRKKFGISPNKEFTA